MDPLLIQIAVYLGAALLVVPLATRLGLGSVLGFLAAGLFIGPVVGLVGAEPEHLLSFGEYGIAVMLFLVGLELTPRTLWDLRHRLLGLGSLQVLGVAAAIAAGARLLGEGWPTSITIGLILALSSTALVVQTLAERRLLAARGGQAAFAVLLTQDLAVVPMLAALPLLAGGSPNVSGDEAATLIQGASAGAAAILTLGAVGAVVLAGIFATRPAFRWTTHAHLREIDTALALFVVVSIIALMKSVGLSPALGTFLAGVVLAGSEYRQRLETDLQPFKGLLLGLFFIGIGAGVDLERLLARPLELALLGLGLVAVKAAVHLGLAGLFGIGGQDRWVFALGLAQGGEFGFVLVAAAGGFGLLEPGLGQDLLLVIALSMLVTPLLFVGLARTGPPRPSGGPPAPVPTEGRHPVIIAGAGRFGRAVTRILRSAEQEAVLLDSDLTAVETMRGMDHAAFLGDPTRPEVLEASGLATARVLVVALDDPEAATRLVAAARRTRPDLRIIARARDSEHAHALVHAGADITLREVFDAALRAGRAALEALGTPPEEAEEVERRFADSDRAAVEELAALWRPDLPSHRNSAYLRRRDELRGGTDLSLGPATSSKVGGSSKTS